jgi:hypothetical protein
MTYY